MKALQCQCQINDKGGKQKRKAQQCGYDTEYFVMSYRAPIIASVGRGRRGGGGKTK